MNLIRTIKKILDITFIPSSFIRIIRKLDKEAEFTKITDNNTFNKIWAYGLMGLMELTRLWGYAYLIKEAYNYFLR